MSESRARAQQRIALLLAASVVFASCAPQRSADTQTTWSGADWPTYQLGPDHNAVLHDVTMSGTPRWDVDLGAKVNGGLAYSGGLVFVTTFDDRLVAFEAKTGAKRWQASFDNVMMSSPVVRGRRIVVGSGDNGMNMRAGETFAYAALIEDRAPFWGRDSGDHIFGLDPATGERAWSFRTAGEDMPSPALIANHVVFANGDGHAYSIALSSGAPEWQAELSGIATMASATAVPGTDVAIVSVCGTGLRGATHALDAKTGAMRWHVPYGDCDSSPTIGQGRVFLTGTQENEQGNGYGGRAVVAAVDARTGRLLWAYRGTTPGFFSRVASSERAIAGLYDRGRFFAAFPATDEFKAFDASSGAVRWTVRSLGPIKMSAVASGGKIIVGDTAGLLYVIDEASGRIVETQMFGAPFTTSPPVIVNDELFVINGTHLVAEPVAAIRHTARAHAPS